MEKKILMMFLIIFKEISINIFKNQCILLCMVCTLLSNFYGYLMQLTLGVVTFSTLLLKRHVEFPKRNYKVFIYDVSKQAISGIVAHFMNLLFAYRLTNKFTEQKDECQVYFINFFCDVIFGLPISYLFIKIINYCAKKYEYSYLISGNYPENHRIISKEYIAQLIIWILIVISYKVIVLYTILIPGWSSWTSFGKFIITSLTINPNIELFIVMVLFPLIFNITQYWVTDIFLKGKGWIPKPYIVNLTVDITKTDYDEL